MFKKILKGLAIVLGIGALVDLTDICGKAAAYHAMSLHNKEAVDDLLEYLENDENLEVRKICSQIQTISIRG